VTLTEAVSLGLIQGLTEFLPISSTAHLRVVPALVGWDDPGAAFTAVIQLGTLVAVLLYFRHDIARLTMAWLVGLRLGRPFLTHDAKLAWMIAVGTVPVVACGLLFKDAIETTLRSLYVIAAAAIVFALLLMASERWVIRMRRANRPQTGVDGIHWGDAIAVGVAQAFALIPGASRSGVTITAGLFAGLTREAAARYSFLLSLPSVFGAGVYQLYKARSALLASQDDAVHIVVASAVAGVVGYASIAFLLGYLKSNSTYLFIVYRLLLGGALLALLAGGVLQP
jgi:undecaprenyl-diphosphatase